MTDQQQLDIKNPVGLVLGRHWHGPLLIQIGTASLLSNHEQDNTGIDMGLDIIETILNNYVNLDNRFAGLKNSDFVEFINDDGSPYLLNDSMVSDPGHSLEFVGLALKFADIAKNSHSQF